jgi:hypothetical protein
MKNENQMVYMSVDWTSKSPTKRLGRINWALAVRFAKTQKSDTVRLSTSSGYNNQGHYIKTNN